MKKTDAVIIDFIECVETAASYTSKKRGVYGIFY